MQSLLVQVVVVHNSVLVAVLVELPGVGRLLKIPASSVLVCLEVRAVTAAMVTLLLLLALVAVAVLITHQQVQQTIMLNLLEQQVHHQLLAMERLAVWVVVLVAVAVQVLQGAMVATVGMVFLVAVEVPLKELAHPHK
jgi:hypothetical protein